MSHDPTSQWVWSAVVTAVGLAVVAGGLYWGWSSFSDDMAAQTKKRQTQGTFGPFDDANARLLRQPGRAHPAPFRLP